ncbi:MAG TPA: histidinol-phosphate transaminase [Deltaproteobacteria bacterium]|nr:histidinol-phosphate transaminase [Deltaproteobacteria bacterium]
MKSPISRYFRPEVLREHAYTLASHPEAIKLNQNELPYDLPPELKEELFSRLQALPFQRYPLPQPIALKQRTAEMLGVKPGQIQFANGSNVIIQALILATALRGRVMVLDPTFSVYEIEAKLFGNRVVKIPLNEKDFSLPIAKAFAQIKKTKPNIIFLANPNAPTGNLFSEEALLEIVTRARCLVVVDEAYFQFSQLTLLAQLKRFPNLVLLRTFSKGFGLGGVRVGYLVAREAVAENLSKILLPYCLSTVSESIAHFALDHQEYFKTIIAEVIREREKMVAAMRVLPKIKVFDSAANFILFRVKNAKACFERLLKAGILVRNVSDRGHLKNCLRVSVGKPEENEAFLHALSAV